MLSTQEREAKLYEINPGKNRAAICFSGQLRTWRKCVKSWVNIFNYAGQMKEMDIFCHMWDFNTVPCSVQTSSQSVKVEQQEIDELVSILKPKRFIVESERAFAPRNSNQPISSPAFLSQFYGIMRSANLKRQYEIENNMKYDIVVRARYDAYYESNKITNMYQNLKPHSVKTWGILWDKDVGKGRINDMFWVADSDTYDLIADYYTNVSSMDKRVFITKQNEHTFPESVFFQYIKSYNLTMDPCWDGSVKIMRESKELSSSKKEGDYEVW